MPELLQMPARPTWKQRTAVRRTPVTEIPTLIMWVVLSGIAGFLVGVAFGVATK